MSGRGGGATEPLFRSLVSCPASRAWRPRAALVVPGRPAAFVGREAAGAGFARGAGVSGPRAGSTCAARSSADTSRGPPSLSRVWFLSWFRFRALSSPRASRAAVRRNRHGGPNVRFSFSRNNNDTSSSSSSNMINSSNFTTLGVNNNSHHPPSYSKTRPARAALWCEKTRRWKCARTIRSMC
jgi:hypothetical protein